MTECPGTELDVGNVGLASKDDGPPEVFFAVTVDVAVEGGGSVPPDKNDGHRDLSSGRDVPPRPLGDKCDKIAAACKKR